MNTIALIGLLITAGMGSGTIVWAYFRREKSVKDSIEENRKDFNTKINNLERKIDLNTNGILAIMKKTPHLDGDRFQSAAESNGFKADDFIQNDINNIDDESSWIHG